MEYLVHWKGFGAEDDQWVKANDIHAEEGRKGVVIVRRSFVLGNSLLSFVLLSGFSFLIFFIHSFYRRSLPLQPSLPPSPSLQEDDGNFLLLGAIDAGSIAYIACRQHSMHSMHIHSLLFIHVQAAGCAV